MTINIIRPMLKKDIGAVAVIHHEAFERQLESTQWVTCNFNAYPRIMMFVAVNELDQVVGYIQWLQKSGFRKESVMELEQIAVAPIFQGNQIGTQLISRSLQSIKEYLTSHASTLKAIIVTTRTDNLAQKLYEKTLGVKINATIKNLYSHDEVIMISRFI